VTCTYTSWGQSGPKIKYSVSNGLQIEGVNETNAIIYDNDMLEDTPEDEFLWLKYNQGKANLVGNIITRNMDMCNQGSCKYTMQSTIDQWNKVTSAVKAAGIKMVTPTIGADAMLTAPASFKIEDTKWKSSAGADLIIREALKCTKEKPLVILVGGQATTVANAYLKNPSIADRVIVFHIKGYKDVPNIARGFNTIDAWSAYIVMKKMRYINFAGDHYSWYPGKNVNLTQTMINSLPDNHMANSIKKWYSSFFRIESIGDAPQVLYFYNHSLWKDVVRKLDNGETTTSDNFDYLLIASNDWTNYGPTLINYMKDPSSYLQSTNKLPSINILSPASNATSTAGTTITITANANDTDGSVTKVEFFNGAVKLGEDATSPYSFQWTNVPAGSHNIRAKATDNLNGVTTSASVSLVVGTTNTPPVIKLTNPIGNSVFVAGTNITMNATASDANGTISKVEFYRGTVKLGEDLTSPYTFQWNNVQPGSYALSAKATDNQGVTTTSTAVNIKVNDPSNTVMTISVTSPASNASFLPGSTITLKANATNTNGSISKVEFFQGDTKLGEDLVSPYTFDWKNVSAGNYTITAKATDTKGTITTSAGINITVHDSNTPPVITIIAPSHEATFTDGTPITLSANAGDDNGSISKIEFFNGTTKIGESLTSPYNFVWSNPPVGTHTITAKATDNQSAIAVSNPISVVVVAPTEIVTIELTSPVNNASFVSGASIEISADAQIVNGTINKVEFFNGAEKLAEDLTSPYSYLWSTIPSGTHELIAKATTDQNTLAESKSIHIVVTDSTDAPVAAEDVVPRYFTPNDDGLNDVWEFPEHELLENAHITIFNRSGKKVYEGYAYQDPWDGKLEGKPLEADAYYYVIRLSDSNDDIKGAVRIIR
jgi:gliding motility-associated-like protein